MLKLIIIQYDCMRISRKNMGIIHMVIILKALWIYYQYHCPKQCHPWPKHNEINDRLFLFPWTGRKFLFNKVKIFSPLVDTSNIIRKYPFKPSASKYMWSLLLDSRLILFTSTHSQYKVFHKNHAKGHPRGSYDNIGLTHRAFRYLALLMSLQS